MSRLFSLVGKNLKLLVRAKASSLVIVLGPLLLVFLAGLAFDNSDPYALRIGAYAPTYTETVLEVFSGLRERFSFSEFSSEEGCEGALLSNRIHACIVFAGNFTMGRPGFNDVDIITDYSRVNLAGTIMTVLDESLGEDVSSLSLSLTEELVDSIEFTKERVDKQRAVLVKLTTENQLISESSRALSADLGDMDLSFDPADFADSNLTAAKMKVKHWVLNAFTVAEQSLTKASSFISAADSSVTDVDEREAFQDALTGSVQKIAELRENLATSKDLAETNFAEFDASLEELNSKLRVTRERFQGADSTRELGLRVLDAIIALLDNSLLNLLQAQLYLNEIGDRIDGISITDPNAIVQPFVMSVRPVVAESSYLNYIFPSLIVLVIMFTSLLIGPTLVQIDRQSPAFFRNIMSPVSPILFFLSKFISCFVLILGQLVIILSVASVVFSASVLANIFVALLVLLLVCVVFISIGLIVGYSFHSEQTSILGGISLGAILMFLSDLIIPLESMPHWLSVIAGFSPFVAASDLLRGVMIFGTFSWSSFFILLVFAVILLAACVLFFSRRSYSSKKKII